MIKRGLFVGLIIVFILFSCSSDSKNESQLTIAELLIQGNPWPFNHYKMLDIIDSGNSTYTQAAIEAKINENSNREVVIFNDDMDSACMPKKSTCILGLGNS